MQRTLASVAGSLLARAKAGAPRAPWLLPAAAPTEAGPRTPAASGEARPRAPFAPPGSQALAAAGCFGLALRHGGLAALASSRLAALAEDAGGKAAGGALAGGHGSSIGAATAPAAAAAPAAPGFAPAPPLHGLAAVGLGLAAAASGPPGAALASFAPANWRGGRWGLFGPERRATDVLLALNAGMYGLQQMYPGLVLKLARFDYLVSQGEVWRLLTPALIHGSLFHLAINSLSLFLLGPTLEAILGRKRFVAAYAASAIAGNALAWWVGAAGYSMSVGASSSISGLFGAYVAFRWLNRHSYGVTGGDLSWLAQIVGINVLIQIGSHSVDGWAHLGGALGGAAVVALMGPRPGKW
ncbi:MAG: hypothetical protein J3K34DRAFT_525914 [Monoraphidium minutum]|nr:MAG: hypothetical protein J3K34DRAFT_525914 [Monoraphidium minutum]